MKEYKFKWRRIFYNPNRFGKWRAKRITGNNTIDACCKMVLFLDYFNVEVSNTVILKTKEINIDKQECITHLLQAAET